MDIRSQTRASSNEGEEVRLQEAGASFKYFGAASRAWQGQLVIVTVKNRLELALSVNLETRGFYSLKTKEVGTAKELAQ